MLNKIIDIIANFFLPFSLNLYSVYSVWIAFLFRFIFGVCRFLPLSAMLCRVWTAHQYSSHGTCIAMVALLLLQLDALALSLSLCLFIYYFACNFV